MKLIRHHKDALKESFCFLSVQNYKKILIPQNKSSKKG